MFQSGLPRHRLYAVGSSVPYLQKAHGTKPVPWLSAQVGQQQQGLPPDAGHHHPRPMASAGWLRARWGSH